MSPGGGTEMSPGGGTEPTPEAFGRTGVFAGTEMSPGTGGTEMSPGGGTRVMDVQVTLDALIQYAHQVRRSGALDILGFH
jgi:hypothetical protein